jgi:hypothetical protein
MKKNTSSLIKLTWKSVFSASIFTFTLIWLTYAATITSTSDTTVTSGDSITANWYQDVNNKLGGISVSGGNVGIGIIPKNWSSNYKAIQLWAVWTFVSSESWQWTWLSSNAYYDGSYHKYIKNNDEATQLIVDSWTWDMVIRTAPAWIIDSQIYWEEVMRIKNNGAIGIGTDNPIWKLDVRGNSEMRATTESNILNLRNIAWSATTVFKENGNIGIWTTSPWSQLEINPKAVDTNIFSIRREDNESIALFEFFQDSNIQQWTWWAHISTNNRDLAITTDPNSTLGNGIYIKTTGEVGIWTATPTSNLEIKNNNDWASTLLTLHNYVSDINDTSKTHLDFVFTDTNENGTPQARITAIANTNKEWWSWMEAEWTADLIFSTAGPLSATTSNLAERMRISSKWNILFGNYSANWTSGGLEITPNTFPGDHYELRISWTSTSSTNLHVFANPNGYVWSISTSWSSTSYNTTSDYRLKENVTAISNASERLNTLKPVRFNYKTDTNTTVDGFLAHEVQKVVPEAVSWEKDWVDKEGNPEYQAMDYAKVTPLLTAALQEALEKIEKLEERVSELENK